MEKKFVTWEEVDEFVDLVTDKYKDKHLTGVYGLPKGGLVLSVMIAYRMNIPLLMAASKGCLIVDDIADTGLSLEHYATKSYQIATMYYHKHSTVVPNFWWKEKKDIWICYPWEKGENE